jgi:hypothetical protein
MNGPDVFKFASEILIRRTEAAARTAGLTVHDIDLWVPHQANRRIIEAAARRIGLPMERVMVNIHRFGNTSDQVRRREQREITTDDRAIGLALRCPTWPMCRSALEYRLSPLNLPCLAPNI